MKFTKKILPVALTALLATTLSACGGGGSSGAATSATPITTSFPIQQALAYAFTHGMQANLAITGTATSGSTSYPLTGTLSYALGIASNTTFEGAAAQQATEDLNASISINGMSQPLFVNSALIINAQYAPIGARSSDSYCVASGTPAYPATANVGQSGDIVTMNCYADSTKRTLVNTEKLSYVAAAGSDANTLNFQMITTDYGLTTTPQSSNTITYAISTAGVPKLVRVQATQTDSGVTITLDAK
ncbi:hypothetical protein H3H36_22860 [Duganella sp. FT3S]|uniref:Lipoprotein n=1 Tax=Rugamonas fusca TaxID=2758568 RepID=A0A7W2I965_9BURK|nr:hypothetical protein [Rugamonas fusca]MBA5608195.1 hypothetical protein [Rugamonas fusca]